MLLRHRPMRTADIAEVVEIIANHPAIGLRYGSALALLPAALARLLASETHITRVIIDSAAARICFVGIGAFVREDFLDELKRPPHFWIGPELTRRIAHGESPLLTAREVRELNSRGGLSMVVWEGCSRRGYEANGELVRCMMSLFIETHRGYLWKEIISPQHESPDHLLFVLSTGGRLWDPEAGGYTAKPPENPADIFSRPYVVGATRETEAGNWSASWVGALFDYHPPVLGLSRSEQRLATAALQVATDEQLAAILEISLSAVKKLWISIHQRAGDRIPELVSSSSPSGISADGRGKEKRRRLLAWLREHPQELRPFSRRLLTDHGEPRARANKSKSVAGVLGL